MHKLTMGMVFAALMAALLGGCQSYDIVQSNFFANEDGDVVGIEYGRSTADHVNTFIAPSNGEKMEFKSRLVVRVTMPDGERFTAWQCMNVLRSGTMYKTDDEEWMILVNGFTTTVYRQTAEDPTKYLELYRGVICETPKTDYKESDKWRKLKKGDKGKNDWR